MARIAGVDLPRDKRIEYGLTYIYGIGLHTSREILKKADVAPDIRVKDLTEEEEDGELRVSFEDAMVDFFFEGDTMTAVSWGVLVDEQGEII